MDNFKHKRPLCYGTYSILCIEKSGQWWLCEKGQEQETKESQFSLSPILISSSSIYLAHFPLAFLDRFFALICANLCPQRSLFSVLNFGSCPIYYMTYLKLRRIENSVHQYAYSNCHVYSQHTIIKIIASIITSKGGLGLCRTSSRAFIHNPKHNL